MSAGSPQKIRLELELELGLVDAGSNSIVAYVARNGSRAHLHADV